MNFGGKIKHLRVKMNLTQEELAARCDLSKGFISQIERDLASPSIATLVDILECLGTDLKHFFSDSANEKVVFSRGDMFGQDNAELGHKITWLIANAQKNRMEPMLIRLDPGGRSDEYAPHEGEVFGYVLSGGVNLFLGSAKHKVKKGESFNFPANAPYRLENPGKNGAVVLWVTSPPNF